MELSVFYCIFKIYDEFQYELIWFIISGNGSRFQYSDFFWKFWDMQCFTKRKFVLETKRKLSEKSWNILNPWKLFISIIRSAQKYVTKLIFHVASPFFQPMWILRSKTVYADISVPKFCRFLKKNLIFPYYLRYMNNQ